MNILCAAALCLGLAGSGICAADLFRVEVGYFDWAGGALATDAQSADPLADGCLGQVLLDLDGDGGAPPASGGSPGAGDALFGMEAHGHPQAAAFRVNGAERLGMPGCFLADPGIRGDALPAQTIFFRVWNAPDPSQATGYWDSPRYEIVPGFQQVSFARGEWTFHRLSANGAAALPADAALLSAWPNPFNAQTRILFALREAAFVRLELFNVQGQRAGTLVHEPLSAGEHTRGFDAGALPSGLYFLTFHAGSDLQAVQKLLLVK